MSKRTSWFTHHSLAQHAFGPLWLRVPAKARWRIVDLLNRSSRYCWPDLVDAALAEKDGNDHCDTRIPTSGRGGDYCRTVCGWGHAHTDHAECSCYCGKFKIGAEGRHITEGWSA